MKRLEEAVVPKAKIQATIKTLIDRWDSGDATVRKLVPDATREQALAHIARVVEDEGNLKTYLNDVYQVAVRRMKATNGAPDMVHLSIKRIDRKPCKDWRDFQEIKNQLVGEECEGVEIYPAESRKVDGANQYHMWVIDSKEFRMPFGFAEGRVVSDAPLMGETQEPLPDVDRQRNEKGTA